MAKTKYKKGMIIKYFNEYYKRYRYCKIIRVDIVSYNITRLCGHFTCNFNEAYKAKSDGDRRDLGSILASDRVKIIGSSPNSKIIVVL